MVSVLRCLWDIKSLCNRQFLYGFGTQEGGLLRVRFRMVSNMNSWKTSRKILKLLQEKEGKEIWEVG